MCGGVHVCVCVCMCLCCVCMYVFVLLSNFQVLFQHVVSSLYVSIYKSESMGELLSSEAAEPLALYLKRKDGGRKIS